jgi:hypothetical protein
MQYKLIGILSWSGGITPKEEKGAAARTYI